MILGKPPKETMEIIEFLDHSNRIEGVHDDRSLHDAIEAWLHLSKLEKLSRPQVCKVHRMLMRNQALAMSEKGAYRIIPVYIGRHEAMKAALIPIAMKEWMTAMNQFPNRPKISTEEKEHRSKVLHVKYEKIHPFVDGNGRTGRMFMNWWRIRNGLPILIIHEGEEQMEYYKWFQS